MPSCGKLLSFKNSIFFKTSKNARPGNSTWNNFIEILFIWAKIWPLHFWTEKSPYSDWNRVNFEESFFGCINKNNLCIWNCFCHFDEKKILISNWFQNHMFPWVSWNRMRTQKINYENCLWEFEFKIHATILVKGRA